MKKKTVLMRLTLLLVTALIPLVLMAPAAHAQAASLTIDPVDGEASPKIVLISTLSTKRKATGTFSVNLTVPKDKVEDGKKKVTSQNYTLTSADGMFESESDVAVSDSSFTVTVGEDGRSATITKSATPVDANGNPDPNGEIDWSKNGDGSFSVTANVYCENKSGGDNDKTITLSGSASYITPDGGATVTSNPNGKVKFTAVKVTMENPTGDPTQSATAQTNVNEFTYDGTPVTGICNVSCRAKLEPDTAATTKWAEENVSWSTTAQGGTGTLWISNQAAGPVQNINLGKNVTLRLIGLPQYNSGLGLKTVTLSGGQDGDETTNIQIFFSRDADNHPGGNQTPPNEVSARSPNWFYYWNELIGGPNVFFSSNAHSTAQYGPGEVPAMSLWTNPLAHAKDKIVIHSFAQGSYRRRDQPPATAQWVSGIDYFANVLAHENQHVAQIAAADAILTETTGQWASGWSWRFTNNHYNPIVNPGNKDVDGDNWPDAWPIPANYTNAPSHIEADARLKENVGEGANTGNDWGDNGKQHKTNGKWDD